MKRIINLNKINKIKRNLPLIIVFLVITLALTQLIITHRLATAGESIKEIEIATQRIKQKNEALKQEITQLGSLRRISEQAEELGFVHNQELLHLTPETPVAMSY